MSTFTPSPVSCWMECLEACLIVSFAVRAPSAPASVCVCCRYEKIGSVHGSGPTPVQTRILTRALKGIKIQTKHNKVTAVLGRAGVALRTVLSWGCVG